jgi:hypothetical protein
MAKIHRTLWFRFLLLTLLSSAASAQMVPSDDTYVTGASPTLASGSSTSLVVQGSSVGKPSYSFIRFDLKPLTGISSTQVQSAYLRVYVSAVTAAGGFNVYEVTSPTGWAEGTLTYNSGGGTPTGTLITTGGPVSVPYPSGKYVYFDVDVTQALKDWLANPGANNGLALKPADNNISVSFSSKEDSTYSHDPTLVVQVTPGLGGTVTSVGAGAGLAGGPITGSGTISLLPATGLTLGGVKAPGCISGHYSGIMPDGTLICSADTTTTSLSFGAITSGTNTAALTVSGTLSPASGGTITATSAAHATSADNATNAAHATSADSATNATHATNADSAITAVSALTAGSATTAGHATIADSATNADNATSLGGQSASSYARLDLANLFGIGKKQTFRADATFAGLNIAGTPSNPGTLAAGDVWFSLTDHHLHFLDDQSHILALAFTNDTLSGDGSGLTNLNASQLTTGTVPTGALTGSYNISITGSASTATHATSADSATNADHATSADTATHALSADTATNAGHATTADSATSATHAISADSAAFATMAGAAATATNADHATTADNATHATNSDQLGGVDAANYARRDTENTFALGKKQTVQGNGDFAGLNIAGFAGDPSNNPKVAGDLWFNTTENHLKFQDANGNTKTIAFTDSALTGDGSSLTNLNASQLSTGTVPQGRLSGSYNIDISGTAAHATNADHATSSDNATHATSADNATHADHATNADHATSADSTTNALHADMADMATNATNAGNLGGVAAANYARLDIGNAFNGNQTIAGQVHATSSTGDAIVGTSTGGNSGVSGSGANGVVGTANGSVGSIGVRGDASVVDGLVHYGVEGVAADATHSIAGVFDHTGGGKILSGRNNNTEVFSVDGNGKVTGDGSGLTNVTAGTFTGTINGSQVSGNISGNAASITGSINGSQVNGNIAGNATSITGSITGGQVSSTVASAVLASSATSAGTAVALQGTAVSGTAPTNGQVLQYNGTNTQWQPTDITGSFIQNGTAQQTTASFNIDGTGVVGGSLTAGGTILPLTASGNSKPSFPLDFKATGNTGTSNTFRLLADGTGAAPVFDFQTCSGTSCAPSSTGLLIDNTGKITFAAGQTFPGSGSVTSVGTGTGLTGGPITNFGTISIVPANTSSAIGGVKGAACGANSHYNSIAGDGTLTCTTDATTISLSFGAITTGMNTTSLTIGAGGSLNVAGGGTINATSLSGELAATSATAGTIAARDVNGNLTATQFNGSGAGLTNVPTSSLTGAPVRVIASTTSAASPTAGTTATAVASCSAGRVLLGGGAQVTNTQSADMAAISQSFPSSASPGQWTAVGVVLKNMNGTNTVTVTAYALCSGS